MSLENEILIYTIRMATQSGILEHYTGKGVEHRGLHSLLQGT